MSCRTRVINIRSGEPYDVYIGRANRRYRLAQSVWANVYTVKRYGREGAIARYKLALRVRLQSSPSLREESRKLLGVTLGCWCPPLACHGHAIIDLLHEFFSEVSHDRP